MVDTLSGIIIEDRLVQFEKVCSFIPDRFSLSVIDDNASQLLNAFLPISLILLGSSIYFRLSQERNASAPIEVVLFPNAMCFKFGQK